MTIDAHQHFWQVARGDYGWLTPALTPLYRDFGPADLAPLLAERGIEGTVLVQAAPTGAETAYLLQFAEGCSFVRGVVGWVDFEDAAAARQIEALARNPRLVGLRPMIQDIPDPEWMLRPGLAHAFEALIACDLAFDALTYPRHLPHLRVLLERYPRLRIVIDHGSKPQIEEGAFDDWAAEMARLAGESEACCKLSGLVTEAGVDWSRQRLKPYVDHLLEVFGPQRIMWGSDWPVCTLAAGYAQWHEACLALLAGVSKEDREHIFEGTARRFYRLRD